MKRALTLLLWLAAGLGPVQVSAQTLYATDSASGCIYRITPDGKYTVLVKDLKRPTGLAYDGHGTLYFTSGTQIYKASLAGKVTPFAQVPVGNIAFNTTRLAIDSRGTVYFFPNNIMGETPTFRINSDGQVDQLPINPINRSSIAVSPHDDVYISDPVRNHLTIISGSTTKIVKDRPMFNKLAFDPQGILYALQETLDPSADESTWVFSIYKVSANGDATLYKSGIPFAKHMAADGAQNLYLANESTIWVLAPNQQVRTLSTGFSRLESLVFVRGINATPPPVAPAPNLGLMVMLTAPAIIFLIVLAIVLFIRMKERKD